MSHIGLDMINEKIVSGKYTEQYLGCLYTMDDITLFGYCTSSKIKFILLLQSNENALIKDAEIKHLFSKIHQAYIQESCNPFFDATRMNSSRFLKKLNLNF